MANIMNLTKVSNRPSRNGFDLSQKINFTAKVGELLPVWWTPVIPGDNIKINLQNFIRTQSLNSAAFARMRGYYDFYFVPYRQLWDKFDIAITQMTTNLQVASGPVMSDNKPLTTQLPYFTCEQVGQYVYDLHNADSKDPFGFSRALQTTRLLQMLGYGDFSGFLTGVAIPSFVNNLALSPFPLLAYQKIYADFNRYTQWEKTNPSTFNINYIKGNGDLQLNFAVSGFTDTFNMFDLRYSNWQKDLFHGVLPVAQYGDASVVPVNGKLPVLSDGSLQLGTLNGSFFPSPTNSVGINGDVDSATGPLYYGDSNSSTELQYYRGLKVGGDASLSLSILALRRAEAAQKWKEVALAAEEDYVSQIQAHWGDKPSNMLSGMCRYLGGISCNLDINAITNTNLADQNAALQRATGTFSSNGNINFESNGQYGIIMCIFRALPILDYTTSGVYFGCTLTDVTDFPIPEFDRIGMESVPVCRAANPTYSYGTQPPFKPDLFLGYAPRYVDWKTAIDVSRGEFAKELESYVMKFNDHDLFAADSVDFPDNPNVESDSVKAGFFKVNPHIVDTLFAVDADKADQLLCSTFFDVKAVRSLDTNGLPY